MKERPFVICHMLTSLEGKIDGAFFGTPQTAPALKVYSELRSFYGCQATLYGTNTMLGGYADGRIGALSAEGYLTPGKDWVNPQGKAMGNFIVSVDPAGELAFASSTLEKKGRPAAHVIEALTRQATPGYLAYLQKKGISYVFAGKKQLDCALLLQKLHTLFGVEKLMLAGGGITNWSFASEGLVDEVSLVIAPAADGGSGVSCFEQAPFLPAAAPVPFHLKSAETPEPDVLWLRYTHNLREQSVK